MAWIQVDASLPDHPKTLGLSSDAGWLLVLGWLYCQRVRSDGFIQKAALGRLGFTGAGDVAVRAADELVRRKWWRDAGESWECVNYLKYQQSKADVESEAEGRRERQRKYRERVKADQARTLSSETPALPETVQTNGPVRDVPRETQTHVSEPRNFGPKHHARGLVMSPLEYDRLKKVNAFVCDRFRVPSSFHEDLVGRYGGDPMVAEEALQAWYLTVQDALGPDESIPNIYKFLNPRFEAWVADRAKAVSAPGDGRLGITPEYQAQLDAAMRRREGVE